MINCTNHFAERWVERIVGLKDDREKREYMSKNRDMIIQHANTMFDNADFLWKGQIGDNTTKHYYMKDDTVLITNTTNDAFVTVYKIDLGFTPELNVTVRKGLVAEIEKLREEKESIEETILTELVLKESEASSLEEEEKIIQEQLKNVQARRKFINEEVKNIKSKSLNTGLELKRYTMMLVNSQEYKEDLRSSR